MKRFIPLCLISLVMLGCLGSQQTTTQPPEVTDAPQVLAEIHLSTPQTNYAAKEAIPLEISIQNGKFDLFVRLLPSQPRRAFTNLKVTDVNGEISNVNVRSRWRTAKICSPSGQIGSVYSGI